MIQRSRMISAEFFHHELLVEIEQRFGFNARVAYAGLWTMTDREGRFEWKPIVLKNHVMPFDRVDFGVVLDVFARAGFIVKYTAYGRDYGWIPRFLKWQSINGRETASALPPPPADVVQRAERGLLGDPLAGLGTDSLFGAFGGSVGGWIPAAVPHGVAPAAANGVSGRTSAAGGEIVPQRGADADPASTPPAAENAENGTGESKRHRKLAVWGVRAKPENGDAASHDDAASSTRDAHVIDVSATREPRGACQSNRIESNRIEEEQEIRTSVALVPSASVSSASVPSASVPAVSEPIVISTLPALSGPKNHAAIIARLGSVMADVHAGARLALKKRAQRELAAEIVFAYWQAKTDHMGSILDAKRLGKITARLDENGGNVHELLYAIDGALKDDHLMGRNGGRKYDGVETIFRDRGIVERLAESVREWKRGKRPHALVEKYKTVLGEIPVTSDPESDG